MDEYVWSHSEGMQRILGLVRSAIRADEGFSDAMPTYTLLEVHFAGWKKQSIYPAWDDSASGKWRFR